MPDFRFVQMTSPHRAAVSIVTVALVVAGAVNILRRNDTEDTARTEVLLTAA